MRVAQLVFYYGTGVSSKELKKSQFDSSIGSIIPDPINFDYKPLTDIRDHRKKTIKKNLSL